MRLPPKSIVYKNQIELRLLSPKDGPAIFQAATESMPALKQFMSWAHYPSDLATVCSIYADFEAKSLRGEEANFAGFDAASGECLFCASLVPGSRLNPAAYDIGYWVSSKHTKKGIGTLAAKTMVALGFQYFHADRVLAVCNPENIASLKVIKNCGFHFEGVLRNHLAKPSEKMISDGYSAHTDASCFSIVTCDIPHLSWVEGFQKDLHITPFC